MCYDSCEVGIRDSSSGTATKLLAGQEDDLGSDHLSDIFSAFQWPVLQWGPHIYQSFECLKVFIVGKTNEAKS
jgi:hypothetical protein